MGVCVCVCVCVCVYFAHRKFILSKSIHGFKLSSSATTEIDCGDD